MTYEEAKTKAQKILVKNGDHQYNEAQARMMKDEIIGNSFETRAKKIVEVVEHTDSYTDKNGRLHNNNNIIIKIGDAYDAVAGTWFIVHVERGSFKVI